MPAGTPNSLTISAVESAALRDGMVSSPDVSAAPWTPTAALSWTYFGLPATKTTKHAAVHLAPSSTIVAILPSLTKRPSMIPSSKLPPVEFSQPDAGNAMPAVVAGLQQFSKDIRIALGDFAAQSNNRLAIAGGAARLAASAEYTKARQITRVAKVCFLMDALPVQPTNKKQNASFGRFEG